MMEKINRKGFKLKLIGEKYKHGMLREKASIEELKNTEFKEVIELLEDETFEVRKEVLNKGERACAERVYIISQYLRTIVYKSPLHDIYNGEYYYRLCIVLDDGTKLPVNLDYVIL